MFGAKFTYPRWRDAVRGGLAVLLISLGLVSFAVPAASLGTAQYNGLNGDLDSHSSITQKTPSDLTNSSADDSYGGGAKEDDVCPPTGAGSIPPNKDDLRDFWVGIDGDYLYLAWSRTNTNGTATIEFELNQNATGCGNGVNRLRTEGDRLITFDFQGGTLSNVPIEVRTWNGTKWGPAQLLNSSQKEASISADLTFGEMVIDLRASGIFKYNEDGSPAECTSFAYAFPKSRASSSSFTNQLKDFIGGVPKTITNCGSLTVIKQATPESSTSFAFGVSGGPTSVSNFNLVDSGSATTPPPNEKTVVNLKPGNYTITETLPVLGTNQGHWSLTSVNCSVTPSGSGLSRTVAITANSQVTCTFNNAFDPPPTVSVTKTASPTSVNEPGGSVTYTVSVWNTSNEAVTVTSLTDTIGPDATSLLASAGNTDCDTVSRSLAASNGTRGGADTMECTFTLNVTGNAGSVHDNTVAATVTDTSGDTATDDDDERVTVRDVLPTLQVTKTVQGNDWVTEPGGSQTYDVQVVNTSVESVTLTALTDKVLPSGTPANLFTDSGNCSSLLNKVLTAYDGTAGGTDTATCSFTVSIAGNAGEHHDNRVTATVRDDENNSVSAFDDERVDIVDAPPSIDITKTASPKSVSEPGANVAFTLVIKNLSNESVTITALDDTVYGDLLAESTEHDCDDLDGDVLAANDSATGGADETTCTFTLFVGGEAGATHENTATVVVEDDEGNPVDDSDDETVTILDVLPDVMVTKTAEPTSVDEPGGNVTFTVVVENKSVEPVTITSLGDVVTGGAPTDLLTLANSNCSTQGLTLAAADATAGSGADTFTCTFTVFVAGDAGDEHHNTVTVVVRDNEGNQVDDDDDATVVVEDVLPTIELTKTAGVEQLDEPGGTVTYTVTIANTSVEPVTITSLTDQMQPDGLVVDLLEAREGNECADLAGHTLAADDKTSGGEDEVSCTFTSAVTGNAGFTHRNVVRVVAVDNEENEAGANDDASVTILDVAPEIDVEKTANPTAVQEPGGNVTYTVTISNLSDEPVTLTSLTDVVEEEEGIDVFGIAGTTCEAGVELAATDDESDDDTYTCTFSLRVEGASGATVTDVVTAIAHDDDGTPAEASDDATVTITAAPPPPPPPPPPVEEPGIRVVKSASAGVVRSGDTVTYTYVVTNTGDNALSDVSLTDDKCSAVEFVGGDSDGDEVLDLDESWTFTCEQALTEDTTNVATVVGTDPDGDEVDDTDDAFVDVINPAIAIDKSANVATAIVGDTIVYTYVVTNPGDDPLSDVVVTDDKCSPVTFVSGDTDGDQQLDTDETWTFTCSDVAEAAGQLTNVAVAVGTPTVGPDVDADDMVTVPVGQVLGEVFTKPPAKVAPAVLARTGAEVGFETQLALVLLGVGLTLTLSSRRRRRQV